MYYWILSQNFKVALLQIKDMGFTSRKIFLSPYMKCRIYIYIYIYYVFRNEVWRFQPAFKTEGYRARLGFLRGIQWGFGAFLLTIAVEKLFEKASGSGDHGHGHH